MQDQNSSILDVIKNRRSVRRFAPEKIDKSILIDMIEAARWAPSAGNRQPVEVLIITNLKKRKAITELTDHQRYIYSPVVLLICINNERARVKYGKKIGEYLAVIDSTIAVQNIMLVAAANGLGTVWGDVLPYQRDDVKKLFKIPDHITPFTFIPVGYPGYEEDEGGPRSERRPLEEMLHWEMW